MNDAIYEIRDCSDGVRVPRIWVALALSLLVHAASLWQLLPHLRLSFTEAAERNFPSGPLVVQLSPPPRPSPAPPPFAAPQAQRRVAPPAPRAEPKAPQVAARPAMPPVLSNPSAQPFVAPRDPAVAAAGGDMLTYLEARRRARGEPPAGAPPSHSAPPAPRAESDDERASRMAALNIGSGRTPTFGSVPVGGGIFGIQRVHEHYAEFIFYGWNKDIRRNTSQLIEVTTGNASNIRIAMIRRMIAIIREHEDGDFTWESKRLGRYVTLSARLRDNAGLEDFLMREFFDNAGATRP